MLKNAPQKTETVCLSLKEFDDLLKARGNLAAVVEDICERHGLYKKSFVNNLKKSLKELRTGKTVRINSLADLLK